MKRVACAVLALASFGICSAQTLGDASKAILEGHTRSARVELKDAMGDYVRKATNSNSPVYADVSVIKDFPEPTCKRLQVLVTAPGAVLTDKATGKSLPFSYRYEMNLCANGYPPPKQ